VPVVRSRARLFVSALVCLLVAAGLSLLVAAPAQAAPPNIIGPANGVTLPQIPTLSWERLPDAAKYDVQVSTTDTFATRLVDTSTVNSQYTPIVQLPVTDLWWRVRVTGSGDPGWATAQFTRGAVTAPTMLGPTGVLPQPDSPPLISWTPVPGATQYNLQVSSDPDFTDPTKTVNYTPTRTTSGINPVLAVPNTYYARVKADLGGGITTAYSQPTSYTIQGLAAATRISPANNGVVTDAVLDWKPVPGAATYQVQIDDDSAFGSPVTDQTGITGTRYSPPKTVGNDTYFWRVRPIDASGNARTWTDADRSTFSRAWPGQVHLEYPANGATVGNPFYFQWSPSERTSVSQEDLALSSSYTLELSTSSTFQGTVQRCNTVETTWVPQQGSTCWPNASGTYYWRVVGHDDWSGARPSTDVPSSEVRSFTYQPDVPTLVEPVNGDHVTIPTLSWSPVAGASRYRVSISLPGGGAIVDTTASTSYTPHELLEPGAYSWQVQTVSLDQRFGTSFIFDTGSFVVDAMPAGTSGTPDPLNSPSGRRFPTLKWASVAGANLYEVWAKPTGSVAYTQIADDFSYPAGESLDGFFLDPGDYNWFVKARDLNGGLISSGAVGTFTINPLEVVPDDQHYAALAGTLLPDDPANPTADLDADECLTQILNAGNQSECDALRNTPVLRWADKPNVGSYLLYVAHDKEMTNPVYDLNQDGVFTPITLTQPMWTPAAALPDSQAGTAYYYRVVPCSYQKCEALAHAEHSFDKLSRKVELNPARFTSVDGSAPVECPVDPAVPNHQVCENDVTLSWLDYRATEKSPDANTPLQSPGRTEARSYVVQTATDPSFQTLIESAEVDQTTFTSYLTTYPEGTVYWRVQAVDGSANKLDWSETGVFDKRSPVPVLLSPDGSQDVRGDLYFSWASLPYAAQYRVEVYKNHDTAANATNLAFPAVTWRSRMLSLTGPLAQLPLMPNGDDPYVWRVRRIDAAGRSGAWSDWGHFRVVEPTTNQTSPPDNASVAPSDALFTWTAVPGAESYRFERRLAGGLTTVEPITTRALSWAPQLAIAGGDWEWRVTPVDASGQTLTPSGWRPFSVDDTVTATTGVLIGGSGRVGTPLTVTTQPQWNFGNAVTTTYQWFRGASAITGEVTESYTLTSADLGKIITVKATGKRAGYIAGTSTSNGVTGLSGQAPVAVTNVSVSGTSKVGTVLTATPPTWDSDLVTTTYQWQRDGVNISGQSTTSYTVAAADVGHNVTIKAMGNRAGYDQGVSVSPPVTGVLGDAPVATTEVTISSPDTKVGTTVTVSPPTWSATGVGTTYQWFRDATAITGATKTTYKLVAADIAASVTVRATGSKAGYTPGSSTSNAIVPEQLDTLVGTTAPTVTGVAAARETLTASPGTWPSGSTYAYQWFVNGLAVARETRSTYVVRTRDAGLPVKVRVTASKTGFLPGQAYGNQVVVKKLATSVTATLESAKIPKRSRGVLNVHVDLVDLGVALGKLQILDGSKVIGTVTMKNDSRGDVQIRLKKLKPGKHKLTVVYLGSAATLSSKSKKVKLVVLK
jgi:large repetitive protein